MDAYYPLTSFSFRVQFANISKLNLDMRFQSVSGLSAEVVTETYREGGQNIKDHVLPVKTQYPDLVLKRGFVALDFEGSPIHVPEVRQVAGDIPGNQRSGYEVNDLRQWCFQMMETLIVQPTDIVISLQNAKGVPLSSWSVKRAWPKKWQISDFNAEENRLAIETMEFNYYYFTIL